MNSTIMLLHQLWKSVILYVNINSDVLKAKRKRPEEQEEEEDEDHIE